MVRLQRQLSDYRREFTMEKEIYEVPELELVAFETEDVITTSGNELPIAPADNPIGQKSNSVNLYTKIDY